MNSSSYLSQNEGHSLDFNDRRWGQASAELSTKNSLASVVLVPSTSTDNHTSQPLQWHVQYYAETLEPSSSVSLFAQTTQEEDEIFYATFPQARGRHWTPYAISNNQYFGDTAFCLSPRDLQNPTTDASILEGTSKLPEGEAFDVLLATPSPVQIRSSSSELMAAINLCGGESAAQIDSIPLQHSLTPSCSTSRPKIEPIDYPLPSPTYAQPMHQEKVYGSSDGPLMDFLAPPYVRAEGSSPQDQRSLAGFTPIENPSKSQLLSSLAGNEPTARTTSSATDAGVAKVESPIFESISLTPLPLPTIAMSSPRAQEPPGTRSDNPSELTGLMRLSPLPMNRRPAEKKKAQTLACNFCRLRKIACGPPLSGTVEKTCNQCQRRSRECVFPTENRRGMRKKKNAPAS